MDDLSGGGEQLSSTYVAGSAFGYHSNWLRRPFTMVKQAILCVDREFRSEIALPRSGTEEMWLHQDFIRENIIVHCGIRDITLPVTI